ncbi:Saccharopine dehydrogenase [Lysobacter dokdonensis DS-58]|uniref:Saccharopine dehydrogenase n=1 Tax=Lysobacter dokdonensis DS-58 TaxID=1300345 RepID=A0A0A2X0R6_9GAMM|nr:saccharopine dehydrogenase NADP-binding domain-containing protein [Lysobacter dokdonensis]KGQ18829.1 Saccharopine dehydrogenase [Lysobacter dokdonensis DS-58]
MTFRVLVLGGYGQFGRRIVQALSRDADMTVIVAGRDGVQAKALCDALRIGARATLEAEAIDITGDFDAALHRVRPNLVIHTAGPFQAQGYDVARAVLAFGAHYIDLADGRAFVEGFGVLDTLAKSHGRRAITGASSVPGISGAVIEAHVDRFASLDSIETGISPGNRTERGLATTRAILGYVGRPFTAKIGGAFRRVHGWQSLRREVFDGVGARWFARCEVPDVGVLPQRYPQLRTCDFRAGLELRRMHFGLWCASWFVRAGLYPRLPARAPLLLAMSERWLSQGSDVGFMHVDMAGVGRDGAPLQLRWTIIARDGAGPRIPATPAVVLARKLARGTLTGSGASACLDLFTLRECLDALDDPAITTSLDTLR